MIRRLKYQGKSMEVRVAAKCERWNPTAEQVKVLTDLFRSGLRTPTTHQIQMISAHLSAFGKIESKNVFYWFQNHKARERHHKKRRRVPPDDAAEDGAAAGNQHKSRTRCFPAGCGIKGKQELYSQRKEIREATETLELFPLKSSIFEEQKVITVVRGGELCGRALYLDATGRDHPPLDLRLSFNYVE